MRTWRPSRLYGRGIDPLHREARAGRPVPRHEEEMMMMKNRPRQVRCPHCGGLGPPLVGRWCDDCERQGELRFGGRFTPRPGPASESMSASRHGRAMGAGRTT
jgi:hypothetical protein